MKTILNPIALNEKSWYVNVLHKVLIALGFSVNQREINQYKAGEDTLAKVRALQAQFNLPVNDSVLIDEATARAIEKILKERGFLEASRSFTVTGPVKLRSGEVKKRQKLLALDLDLRGVAVYRTVKNLNELQKNKGFEFLGDAVSGNQGNYRITFYDWQYGEAERKKADVVVYAVQQEEIIGRSRMVNSEEYSDKGLVRNLEVVIEQDDQRTEYEIVMKKLNAFLEESKTNLASISQSSDQLTFTAGELDIDQSRINIIASAELLNDQPNQPLSHELLYGIGRQNIRLSWTAFYKKPEDELRNAIAKSVDQCIISKPDESEIEALLQAIKDRAVKHMLNDEDTDNKNTLNVMLKNALPEKKQRLSFLNAYRDFKGNNFYEFWNEHLPNQPEFQNKPELISALQFTQQLTLLTGNHQALVHELQVKHEKKSTHELFDLEKSDWLEILEATDVPEFITGKDDAAKREKYAELMQSMLNAAFPTRRISKMIDKNELPIEKTKVARSINTFLKNNEKFDFAGSRIHNFKKEIKTVAGDTYEEVRTELLRMQRVFQVSTTPEAMKVLMEKDLNSAYTIASIPRKNFIKKYASTLGGERAAFAIHQRASHINTRAEMNALHLVEYSHGFMPQCIMNQKEYDRSMEVIKKHMPNPTPTYRELFGSPDICECEHCRSVYSAAAYFVDLLRFLSFSGCSKDASTPFDVLTRRRPDLVHLPLTCENTNTLIPYIDMVNEIMEYYVAKGLLTGFTGYDTGDVSAEELRANPQHVDKEAYSILSNNHDPGEGEEKKKAVYPFTLPYHQPLDVIRTYSDHLHVSRYEVMQAMNHEPDDTTIKAIEAEALQLSPEEYTILTGEAFDGTSDDIALPEYYGYTTTDELEGLSAINEFLKRSGIAYVDLVELIKIRFINPHQNTLDFLEKIFANTAISPSVIYKRLEQIKAGGTLSPDERLEIIAVLNDYYSANDETLTFAEFEEWVLENFDNFRQVITLYEPDSKCAIENTWLKTIRSVYNEESDTSGITEESGTWSKLHRFIRLWRKLGWTIHETDLLLTALGESDITTVTISKLAAVSHLQTATKMPLDELAALWGNIDTYGAKSLYKKLFLNRTVQPAADIFKPDEFGNYEFKEAEGLAAYRSTLITAFRIKEEDLDAIFQIAEVIEDGTPRHFNIDPDSTPDVLNIQYLSTIYRYATFAKALKIKVTELRKLITLFGASPFSAWDITEQEFSNISPQATLEFYEFVTATKEAGFKPATLEYILSGMLSPDSKLGLKNDKILQTVKAIRDEFAAIEQNHPATPLLPLTTEIITAKLSLTFQPEIVSQFMGIIDGTTSFQAESTPRLNIIIPDDESQEKIDELVASGLFGPTTDEDEIKTAKTKAAIFLREFSGKYAYANSSGRLTCNGVMSDAERIVLEGLNADSGFVQAVEELYTAPELFISNHFNAVFPALDAAKQKILGRPVSDPPKTLEDKLFYIYASFLPLLITKLRKDALTKHISALLELREEATSLLIAEDEHIDPETVLHDLSIEGFSGAYFNDADWTTLVSERTDNTIDFSWIDNPPPDEVHVDNFSVRWKAYIAAPASGEYTLIVELREPTDTFRLYLDEHLLFEKLPAATDNIYRIDAPFNSAQMHSFTLEYVKASPDSAIRLSWKTEMSGIEIIPASVSYPATIIENFMLKAITFHQAAMFISGFEISESELDHFITTGAIDIMAPTKEHWQLIYNYMKLRNALPQNQALLIDVFALADSLTPTADVEQLIETLQLATAWDNAALVFLVQTYFNFSVEDFKSVAKIKQLHNVMKIVSKTGIAAIVLTRWGAAATEFDEIQETAELLKHTVKAKYEEHDWLELAGKLNNKIRENQKQALIDITLVQEEIQDAGVTDADGLFEYFLIDVQMSACMDTSRIVQANAAVQMFINRCLLNLEKEISPEAIDKERWEWMKNYRVWEANRKVFLYPENWLEPEWRNDRSEFFKELESYLVQNDITERSVEQAFRKYLMSLNEVANLEVCGMCEEKYDDGDFKFLHIFARTHNAPYKFFYRTWNEFHKWSAWEKVQLDIRCVEDGDNSGVHLIPVVWKKRLFLFWPEFFEKQEQSYNSRNDVETIAGEPMSDLEANNYWEIKLAWSEFIDGKWSPKQLSGDFIRQDFWNFGVHPKSIYRFMPNTKSDIFKINVMYYKNGASRNLYWPVIASFDLYEITSKMKINNNPDPEEIPAKKWETYDISYMNFSKRSSLEFSDRIYLDRMTTHKILIEPVTKNCDLFLNDPFFFSDRFRTYFVRPVEKKIINEIRMVRNTKPIFSNEEENWWDSIKVITDSLIADEVKIYEGLEFHTFYHPYSNYFVKRLNDREGIRKLLETDIEIGTGDEGETFTNYYKPQYLSGLVKTASDPYRTYYKENVCFDVFGANSLYNWELLFHAPLYVATRLSKNGKYEEAMKWFHYIFDPTTDEAIDPDNENSRYWKVLPFKTTRAESLEEWFRRLNKESDRSNPQYNPESVLSNAVAEWRKYPFEPHLVASNRQIAYMKHVVIKYVENLIAWGDSLFRQFTRESVNEALQVYVIANHILGPRPQFVPKRGKTKAESYASMQGKLDDFSNALVQLENIFPYSSDVSVSSESTGTSMLGIGSALYFCIPANDQLLETWDKVADRLFKIRHCQDIVGIERKLALFAPPISPEALIQAVSKGLSLGSILADLSSPPPIYRFSFLLQKANEFCNDVKSLGSALLAAIEKKDAEELSRMRASHETQMLELVTAIRKRQVLEAMANKDNLLKARETAQFRLQHYLDLLGNESLDVPDAKDADLTDGSQLPADTTIETLVTDVDESLVDSDESGIKLIPKEKEEFVKMENAHNLQINANNSEKAASIWHALPDLFGQSQPIGFGISVKWGTSHLAHAISADAKGDQIDSLIKTHEATVAGKYSSYLRREQDWTLQVNLAAKEIIQLDKQITSADIRIQVAEKELENHKKQIENSKDVELFLKDKFTNQELYQWMKEQLFSVYDQSYKLAYDMAQKAEKAYQYEMGLESANFIQYGCWDNSKQGLVAGEKLQLALRQLEKSYLEENRRELELTKHISLAFFNPLALIELKETGKCYFSLSEELFDLDFQGHYFRRIKSVSLSIPCVVGPYTSVNCSLRLLKNSLRKNTSMGNEDYVHNHEDGIWSDDDRFRTANIPVTSIATSAAQNDAGVFEFSFRDERYLPFEGAGVISDWMIELATVKELRQFDYSTISDIIVHLKYTARESGGQFKERVTDYIKEFLKNSAELTDQPLMQMFSMRHEFPNEYHNFLHPVTEGAEQILHFTIGKKRFPFFAHYRKIIVMKIEVFAKCVHGIPYNLIITYNRHIDTEEVEIVTLSEITMAHSDKYGGLNKATINVNDAGLSLEELDITEQMSLRMKFQSVSNYTELENDELEDIFLVFHYKLDDEN